MKTIKARGIVLREFQAGESDKRLLLLCKGYGRVMVYARGVRKQSSKLMAAAQLFTYADFVLTPSKGLYFVAQADIIEMFYNLRTDYDRLLSAHLIAEVCDKSIWDSVDCDDLLFLTIKSLSRLSKGRIPSLQVTCVFLFRFFTFHGLQPEIDNCIVCGISANEMERFYLCSEGLVCGNHNSNVPNIQMNLSHAAVATIRFILKSELEKVFLFTAYDGVLEELKRATRMLWRIHFDGSYIKSLWMD